MLVVQAAGYGGGSLVYANVQMRPPPDVFDHSWLADGSGGRARSGNRNCLTRAVEEWGRERGATRAIVIASLRSSAAIGFYENRMSYERKTVGFYKRL
jgi:DNA integrity scanning protein DisA with diadenylate cyclase activity